MDFLLSFLNSLPGAFGQGLAWGIMAVGVYVTYRILDVADLTVDGSLATGGAVCALGITMGLNPWLSLVLAILAGMLSGLVTGLFHTLCGIPAILSGILTQLALYSVNLRIMAIGSGASTKATLAVSVDKQDLLLSSRYIREMSLRNPLLLLVSSPPWSSPSSTGFSARSWAAPSGPPAPTPTWLGPRASTPTPPRFWAWWFPTAW